ncbi:MAG: MerR family transcriptional regulator [Lachnoclostridium sp.]|jgi:DNA-binding transcriptional MerR regulator|nr:MerR family transcriptional regulator [Lachnoclostridium sp.]
MQETRYIISDAAKKVDVEPHVLRYWEEELALGIQRNELGHRFYTEEDISNFFAIQKLKSHGFHLRSIKLIMPDLQKVAGFDEKQLHDLRYELENSPSLVPVSTNTSPLSGTDKMEQFKQILSRVVSDALQNSESNMTRNITDSVSKEMDYMFRQKEEADEERYRTLDETIRSFQKARQEAAAAGQQARPKKSKKWHKKGGLTQKK